MVNFGENLKAYRKAIGYSQKELSGLCGISRQIIHKHESGKIKPTPENLAIYAKALRVTVVKLQKKPHPNTWGFEVFNTLHWGSS